MQGGLDAERPLLCCLARLVIRVEWVSKVEITCCLVSAWSWSAHVLRLLVLLIQWLLNNVGLTNLSSARLVKVVEQRAFSGTRAEVSEFLALSFFVVLLLLSHQLKHLWRNFFVIFLLFFNICCLCLRNLACLTNFATVSFISVDFMLVARHRVELVR